MTGVVLTSDSLQSEPGLSEPGSLSLDKLQPEGQPSGKRRVLWSEEGWSCLVAVCCLVARLQHSFSWTSHVCLTPFTSRSSLGNQHKDINKLFKVSSHRCRLYRWRMSLNVETKLMAFALKITRIKIRKLQVWQKWHHKSFETGKVSELQDVSPTWKDLCNSKGGKKGVCVASGQHTI